jgi:hypothetical protein
MKKIPRKNKKQKMKCDKQKLSLLLNFFILQLTQINTTKKQEYMFVASL